MKTRSAAGQNGEATLSALRPPKGTVRYAAAYFLLSFALLGAGYLLVHKINAEQMRAANAAAEIEHVRLASNALIRDLEIVGGDILAIARSDYLRDYVDRGGSAARRKLEERLLGFIGDRRIYDQARFIDAGGRERVRINYNGGAPTIVAEAALQDKVGRYYVTETMALPDGAVYLSPLDLNVEQGMVERPIKPMLRVAMPIPDASGRRKGIVILNYLAQNMLDQFYYQLPDGPGEKDEYSIINAEGFWLHHPDKSLEWGFMLGAKTAFPTLYPEVWRRMQEAESGQVEAPQGLFTFSTVRPIRHVSVGLSKVPHDMSAPLDAGLIGDPPVAMGDGAGPWKVISHVPVKDLPSAWSEGVAPAPLAVLASLLAFAAVGAWQLGRARAVRQGTEAALRILSQAVEQNPSMVLITDRHGDIKYVNLRFCAKTGYGKDEVIGRNPSMLDAANMESEDYQSLWETVVQGKNWSGEMWDRRKDGSRYWVASHIAPIRDESGEITHFIGMQDDITEEKALRDELQRLATTDALTGVFNRRHFFSLVDVEVRRAKRHKRPLSVMMIDLDHFKSVNDRYGHLVGDRVLLAVVESFVATLRVTDIFARFGGEEFVVALPDTAIEAAELLAERLRQKVADLRVDVDGQAVGVTVSIGVTAWREADKDFDKTIQRGDNALYEAKRAGRDRVVVAAER